MFKILPRRGKIAWKRLSRPCLALPPAESPSTMKISDSLGSLELQSANLPGKVDDSNTDFRRTNSRALLAASAAVLFLKLHRQYLGETLSTQSKLPKRSSLQYHELHYFRA